jgi:hypothetical protein
MPVNHRGVMSKHKANEKIAILEFIQARLKDIVFNDPDAIKMFNAYVETLAERYDLPSSIVERLNALSPNIKKRIIADLVVKVYDPFTTKMDFNILLDVSWTKYEEIYGKYYNEAVHGEFEAAIDARYADYPEILALIHNGEYPNGVFNASSSESIIFHTITEMREIIGIPRLPEP